MDIFWNILHNVFLVKVGNKFHILFVLGWMQSSIEPSRKYVPSCVYHSCRGFKRAFGSNEYCTGEPTDVQLGERTEAGFHYLGHSGGRRVREP